MTFPTTTITPGSGQTINTLPPAGQDTSANSLPVVLAFDQAGLPQSPAATNWTITQKNLGTSATFVCSGRAGRFGVVVTNLGPTDVYLGISGVTTATGAYLVGVAGASKTITFQGTIYGVAVTGTQVVTVEEFW